MGMPLDVKFTFVKIPDWLVEQVLATDSCDLTDDGLL